MQTSPAVFTNDGLSTTCPCTEWHIFGPRVCHARRYLKCGFDVRRKRLICTSYVGELNLVVRRSKRAVVERSCLGVTSSPERCIVSRHLVRFRLVDETHTRVRREFVVPTCLRCYLYMYVRNGMKRVLYPCKMNEWFTKNETFKITVFSLPIIFRAVRVFLALRVGVVFNDVRSVGII